MTTITRATCAVCLGEHTTSECPVCVPDPEEIDCTLTDELVCPHCGHEHESSEMNGGEEGDWDTECGECEKPFRARRIVYVYYSSDKQT